MAGTQNDFSKGSIPRSIMSLAIPMTAAQLVNVLYSVVDRIYLGRLADGDSLALTGLGITMPIVSILMGFANLCGTLFVMISLGMNPFINAQGFGRVGMMTVLLGAVVNIVLDPVLIFVCHMGVQGAALATVSAQGLSAA